MNIIRFYPFSDKTQELTDPPKPSSRHVPDWYRMQQGQVDNGEALANGIATSTIKRCMPIFDMMTAGYMVTLPTDVYLDSTNPDKLIWSIPAPIKMFQSDMFSFHSIDQYKDYPIDHNIYHKDLLRILPFWSVKTPEGYSAIFMNPSHTDQSPLMAFNGLIDTDKFISDGHFSFLVKKGFKGVLKQGTPIVQIIPFKREDWSSELVDLETAAAEVQKQRFRLRSVFSGGYKNKFRTKKEYK
jgi:hypothetical protein